MIGVSETCKHLLCQSSAKKPSKSEWVRARMYRGKDCAGPAGASAAARSQIAVSATAVADRSAVHHFEAKAGASAWRIVFFERRRMPDKMYPGRLTVNAAKIMPAMISIK
jgi:hypothetical protein